MKARLASNLWFSCLSLLGVGITGVHPHTGLHVIIKRDFVQSAMQESQNVPVDLSF